MIASPAKKPRLTEALGLANLQSVPNEAINRVNINLLQCPDCSKSYSGKQVTNFSTLGMWESRCLLVECNNEFCKCQWGLCIECGSKQRSRISTTKQLKDHMSNNHSTKSRNYCPLIRPCEDVSENQITQTAQGYSTLDIPMIDSEHNLQLADIQDDLDWQMPDEDSEDNNPTTDWIQVVNSNTLGFEDRKSVAYYEQCFLGSSITDGMEYLVMRSARRSELEAKEYSTQHLPPGHADLQTRIANLAFTITHGQTQSLVKVLLGAYKVGCENGFECSQTRMGSELEKLSADGELNNAAVEQLKIALQCDFAHDLVDKGAHTWSTKIPNDWNDVRQMYLEGARSIVMNLPIPVVMKDVPGHSYVSVTACIRHFLAHGGLSAIATIPPKLYEMEIEEVEHPSMSRRAQEIVLAQEISRNMLFSYIFFWSDDVEPNRIKANRGSVWILTATIATHLHNGHSLANTFPIAIGRKGQDHDAVVSRVEKEMEILRTGRCAPFYIGEHKKKVRMTFELFCVLQDQPERRDFNSMRAGNGATTGRFGVSADHNALYNRNVLPACRSCLEKMEDALRDGIFPWPITSCAACVRWDVLDDKNGLAFWAAPKYYPTTPKVVQKTLLVHGKECQAPCLRPFRISYSTLKAAVDAAHNGYVNEGWSNQNCEAFLEVEGISTKYINVVMEHCARSYSLKLAKENPEEYQAILQAAELNPAKYKQAPYPSPWMRPTVELHQHPDVIMHLVFLGIVKTTVTQIQNCLAAQSKLASFLKSTEQYLKEFQTMSIEWIAIQPYQAGKLGGWVSENFLGFSRILPWFFQNIDGAVQMKTDFSPPDNLPQHKWLHRHNKHWLQIRGLNTKGNREELKERVAETIAAGAPDPLPAPEIPTASIEAVLLSLMEVLQCVMCTKVNGALINRTRYAVRVFLSKYDSLCRPLRQKTHAVLSSYNFICLLNLPDVMERFGPLRCIWEGGPKGEGFVRFAKPLMKQGLRQNWQHQLMLKMHRAIAFRSVLQENPQQPQESLLSLSHKDALRERKGFFHLYKSAFDVQHHFSGHRSLDERVPISILLVEVDLEINVLAVIRSYEEVLQIDLSAVAPLEHFGWHYYSFDVTAGNDNGVRWTVLSQRATRVEFGMLLPLLREDDNENRFALISANWKRLAPSVELKELLQHY